MSGGPPVILDHLGIPLRASVPYPSTAFEGATTGRRLSTWGTSNSGPNDTLVSGLANLRARARELSRNNPWMDGGLDTFVAHLVGTSISPRWQIADKGLKREIQELWNLSVLQMDFEGQQSFYGLQALGARSLIEAGEVFCRKRVLPKSSGLLVPFQVQLLEGDLCDHTQIEVYKGNEIRFGIEFTPEGRRDAYWFYKEHPGESYSFLSSYAGQKVRIPAREIDHVYKPLRPGQVRGVSWLKSAILRAHELDKCEDAELVRRTMAGLFGGFIKKPVMGDTYQPIGRDAGRTPQGAQVLAMEPGTWPELPPGWDVVFASPPDAGQGFFELVKHHLKGIAKGTRNTYETLTGDLSEVNFSSIRAGQNIMLKVIEQIQFHVLAFQLCLPVCWAWLDVAVASGAITIQDYAENKYKYRNIKLVPDAPRYVNPLQDVQAKLLERRAGLKSLTRQIAESPGGGDIEEIFQEIEDENAEMDARGLILDSDPRNTASSGAMQKDGEQLPNGDSVK